MPRFEDVNCPSLRLYHGIWLHSLRTVRTAPLIYISILRSLYVLRISTHLAFSLSIHSREGFLQQRRCEVSVRRIAAPPGKNEKQPNKELQLHNS